MGKINIIDPGHDTNLDPGALARLILKGDKGERLYREAQLNMSVANRVVSLTENYQRCILTRRWDTPGTITLKQRVEKTQGYDPEEARFISIHHNSFTNSEVNGIEVYYKEGDWESKHLADRIRENIIESFQTAGYMIQDRETKTAPFYVLHNSLIPAVLVEIGFMSNPVELEFMTSPAGCVAAGFGIALSLLEFE